MIEYSKYWLGECIENIDTFNLKVGEKYLLKDKEGDCQLFHVSDVLFEDGTLIGSYSVFYFNILEDVTEKIANGEVLDQEEPEYPFSAIRKRSTPTFGVEEFSEAPNYQLAQEWDDFVEQCDREMKASQAASAEDVGYTKPERKTKPATSKQPEKPKFVQKGLFG